MSKLKFRDQEFGLQLSEVQRTVQLVWIIYSCPFIFLLGGEGSSMHKIVVMIDNIYALECEEPNLKFINVAKQLSHYYEKLSMLSCCLLMFYLVSVHGKTLLQCDWLYRKRGIHHILMFVGIAKYFQPISPYSNEFGIENQYESSPSYERNFDILKNILYLLSKFSEV